MTLRYETGWKIIHVHSILREKSVNPEPLRIEEQLYGLAKTCCQINQPSDKQSSGFTLRKASVSVFLWVQGGSSVLSENLRLISAQQKLSGSDAFLLWLLVLKAKTYTCVYKQTETQTNTWRERKERSRSEVHVLDAGQAGTRVTLHNGCVYSYGPAFTDWVAFMRVWGGEREREQTEGDRKGLEEIPLPP